ncbi:MAG: FkbM family methyltransferase, partial [Acidimicrobiales bacterium]
GEFDEAGRSTVVVESKRLDDALETHPADIGFIWVDSQGHEAHILDGAPRLLRHSIPWVIEYWPYGLARSGGLERLHDLIEEHFGPVVDVRESLRREKVVAVSKNDLVRAASVMGTDHTDLILLPR